MKTTITLGAVVLIIALGWYAFGRGYAEKTDQVLGTSQQNSATQESMDQKAEMMAKEEMVKKDEMAPKVAGMFVDYAPEKIALAETNDVVLFFNATWCPSCRSLKADIMANQNNIPENTVIVAVDYDTHGDLKKKYGVTMQHTMVQVDAQGNLIKKWSGSPSLAALVSQIQ